MKNKDTTDQLYARLPGALLPWYQLHARQLPWRKDRDPYHIWVSEIMLQQTRVEAVRGYYQRFLQALPNIEALAKVEEGVLLKFWEGLGYYNRARNLQKAAREIVHARNGVFPNTYSEIISLPGVGPYTAGAIASICFNLPVAAVDGNVLRVIARITNNNTPIDSPQMKNEITHRLTQVYPQEDCGAFTQALMELGAVVCTPKSPKCDACPLQDFCIARKAGTAASLPVKLPKKQRKIQQKTVFLLQCGECFALSKRPSTGLLPSLWQFPNTDGQLSPAQAMQLAKTWGTRPFLICSQLQRAHVFTHIRWEMTCYHIQCQTMPEDYIWADLQHIKKDFALPTAFGMFLQQIPE